MSSYERRHPGLCAQLAGWVTRHPSGTLADAIGDLDLWPRPQDKDMQWLVWRNLTDDAALRRLNPATA